MKSLFVAVAAAAVLAYFSGNGRADVVSACIPANAPSAVVLSVHC